MATDAKKSMSPNNFSMPFLFLYLSWILLLCLNPEMWRCAYYAIRREYCEGTLCSFPLSESSVVASRLTSVGFCTLLEWLTWWISPRLWAPSLVGGIEASDMASIPCTDVGSSVMPLGASWGSEPGGRSWGPGSIESSCQVSLGKDILEYLLRLHYFERGKFSCIESSKCSSTRF